MPESLENQHIAPSVERDAAGLVRDNGAYRIFDVRASEGGDANVDVDHPRRRRYKTEYRKKFRPFSLYQYVDGHFQKDEVKGQQQQQQPQQHEQAVDKDTWYREVLELRKKAGEYKYRGLGGELMPQHMMDLYAKQFDVWEQVSRRSTLSALSLAAITPRALNKGDREAKAATRKSSPVKLPPAAAAAASMTSQRPAPGHAHHVASRKQPVRKVGNDSERPGRDVSQQRSYSAEGKSRVKSVKAIKSPVHASAAGPAAAAGNVTLNIRPSLGGIFHGGKPAGRSASAGPEGRAPPIKAPSIKATPIKATPIKARPVHTAEGKNASNNQKNKSTCAAPGSSLPGNKRSAVTRPEKKDKKTAEKDNLPAHSSTDCVDDSSVQQVDAEVEEEELDVNKRGGQVMREEEEEEPLIKALPEPTRVKSPEQIVLHSPDSVNWTVPLDTGKPFTVTQNIRDGEGSRPHSVHSELKVSMTVRSGVSSGKDTEGDAPLTAVKGAQEQAMSSAAPETAENAIGAAPAALEPDENAIAAAIAALEPAENAIGAAPTAPESAENAIGAAPAALEPADNATRAAPAENAIGAALAAPEPAENAIGAALAAPEPAEKAIGAAPAAPEPAENAIGAAPAAPADNAPAAPVTAAVSKVTHVPSGRIRCLEDPLYLFSQTSGNLKTGSGAGSGTGSEVAVSSKAPRYRVLEAPGDEMSVAAPSSLTLSTSTATCSPYKVLEAPSSPDGLSSPSAANRSLASDVLEKARTRFDRFWTKKEGDK